MIFRIIDILVAINLIISLNLVRWFNKAWLYYSVACLSFAGIMLYKGIYGQVGMGLVLAFTGALNYLKGRKK